MVCREDVKGGAMKWVVSIALVSAVFCRVYGQSIEELQDEIRARHGVDVDRAEFLSRTRRGQTYDSINNAVFGHFLRDFLDEAQKRSLSPDGVKRYSPFPLSITVVPEGSSPVTDSRNRIARGVFIQFSGQGFTVGHRSASAAVSFLVERFPLRTTREAADTAMRNCAVRRAIVDNLGYIEDEMGVEVDSCEFSSNGCTLEDEADIRYATQEKLLQGLVGLRRDIESGDEIRSEITMVSVFYHWMGGAQYRHWDNSSWSSWIWSVNGDEDRVEGLIQEHRRTSCANILFGGA